MGHEGFQVDLERHGGRRAAIGMEFRPKPSVAEGLESDLLDVLAELAVDGAGTVGVALGDVWLQRQRERRVRVGVGRSWSIRPKGRE